MEICGWEKTKGELFCVIDEVARKIRVRQIHFVPVLLSLDISLI